MFLLSLSNPGSVSITGKLNCLFFLLFLCLAISYSSVNTYAVLKFKYTVNLYSCMYASYTHVWMLLWVNINIILYIIL